MNGLDYSTWRPPSAAWLRDQGFGFVCRYLAPVGFPKVISLPEYQALRTAGLEVVLVWESYAQVMLAGAGQGRSDAMYARTEAQGLGAWPCPIYFACDFDATPENQVAVNAYLSAAADVLGSWQLVGLYGGYWPVSRALSARTCRYGWQTYAWSGGLWDGRAQLRQVPGGTPEYDLDMSTELDFGQVGGQSQAPEPNRPPIYLTNS